MEQDIKILEDFINKPVKSGEFNKISNKEIQALENLLKRYKELEEENTEWRGKYLIELNRQYYFYIPKAKIKEIIENHYPDVACFKIQELLEERNK